MEIMDEQASGGSRSRPVLAQVLKQLCIGDTLEVVRIDRLARPLSHLLESPGGGKPKVCIFGPCNIRSTRRHLRAISPNRFGARRQSLNAP